MINSLYDLQFDHRFTDQLPADPDDSNHSRQVQSAAYSKVIPTPAPAPQLLAHSPEVLNLLGLTPESAQSSDFLNVFSGNMILPNMKPHAACYGGYQFGQWAGQLGDGRAINLGEVCTQDQKHWMLQLKGAGPTPYSRHADGYAVLRSSIREFLCSEAMYHLGIETTRALSIVSTGKAIVRDMFYDGNPQAEPGAVVCRVAPSFLRFGNIQLPSIRGDIELLRKTVQFALKSDTQTWTDDSPETLLAWFDSICERTLDLVLNWQRVGFVHGVLNTDNMSILGQTIDYGPYGWLENFDLSWTPNTTDAQGRRYCYGRQPSVCYWNLQRLAEALLPLVEDSQHFEPALQRFKTEFSLKWRHMMLVKLGLEPQNPEHDDDWIQTTMNLLSLTETDFIIFYRQMAKCPLLDPEFNFENFLKLLEPAFYTAPKSDQLDQYKNWFIQYRTKIQESDWSDEMRSQKMNAINPKYVLRNYLAQQAIDKAQQGDPSEIEKLLNILKHPYDEQSQHEVYAKKRPEWARNRAGCSMLSCSS